MRDWDIREAKGDDIPFIYSTWLNSYRSDSPYRKHVSKFIYFQQYPRVIDRILNASQTLIACLKDEPNVIIGYLVWEEPDICHYAFTKESFRQLGVAISLWDHAFKDNGDNVTVTHKTKCVDALLEFYNVNFNPFLLFMRGIHGTTEETVRGNREGFVTGD